LLSGDLTSNSMPLDLTSIATSNDLIFTFIVFFFLSIVELWRGALATLTRSDWLDYLSLFEDASISVELIAH
jgi:hypothetical protein